MSHTISNLSRPLSEQMAALKAKAEALEAAAQLVRRDPQLAREVAEGILAELDASDGDAPPQAPQPKPPAATEPLTHMERVRRFFVNSKNEWATTEDLANGTGLNRSQLNSILYKKHTDKFVKEDMPDKPSLKRWKMIESHLKK